MSLKKNKEKTKGLAKFIMNVVPNAPFYFTSYIDAEGNKRYLKNGVNEKGQDVKAVIKWPKGKRVIQFPAGKKDQNGVLFADYVRESPYCRGSELCNSEGAFYEFNPEKDAKVELEEEALLLQALNHAMTIGQDELRVMAAYISVFDDNEDIMRNAVRNYAKRNFREYIKASEAPDLSYYALVRQCISLGIIKKRGYAYDLISDSNTKNHFGNSELEVVTKISADEELLKSLKLRVEQASNS